MTGPWNPTRQPPFVIKSGDQVRLYCHSLGLGPFGNIHKPPHYACPALLPRAVPEPPLLLGSDLKSYTATSLNSDSIHFVTPTACSSPDVTNLIQAYDARGTGEMSETDRNAFETMGFISDLEFAPGPSVFKVNGTTLRPGISLPAATVMDKFRFSEEYRTSGTTNYKKIQKAPSKFADSEWDGCRRRLMKPVDQTPWPIFTIIFE